MIRLPDPCLVVLVGPSGSGKSHWADEQFPPNRIVSSDQLRALVGEHEHDQRAGTDAFAVLDLVLERRLKRRLFTVVDTLGLDATRRQQYLELARRHRMPAVAVAFDTPPAECRARKARRSRPVPAKVLAAQLKSWAEVRDALAGEGFDHVYTPDSIRIVDPSFVDAPAAAQRQLESPLPLDFGLHVASFTWPGGPPELGARLAAIARAAEEAGFTHLSVMDHFLQIPQIGRRWDEMLDSWTTLGYLAAHTSTLKLLTLVTGITYRNVAHLGKIAATLDVLSGGRAICGVGAAWNEDEHHPYGWRLPPVKERFALLEDALKLLPLMWGAVRHKLDVLHKHCEDVGRDPADIRVTQLSGVVLAGAPPDRMPPRMVAGTVEDHIGRYRELAEVGVQTAFVRFPDLGGTEPIERFAPVIEAFRT